MIIFANIVFISCIKHFVCSACLRSWLEQDTSCPTCRTNLGDPSRTSQQAHTAAGTAQGQQAPQAPIIPVQHRHAQPNRTFNHFFHFDGKQQNLRSSHRDVFEQM